MHVSFAFFPMMMMSLLFFGRGPPPPARVVETPTNDDAIIVAAVVFACRSFPRSSSSTTLFVCVDCYMFWTDSLLSRVLYNTAENCNSFQNLYELFVSRVRNLTFAMRELCESRCGLSRQCIFTFLSTRFITQSTRRVDMVLYVV